jgi:drug/metabolite transporter (DMT)-like permease
MTNGDVPLAALICLFSALGFAASNALQHRVAGTVPASAAHNAIGVLAQVVRRPLWLLATTISFSALLLHATALKLGSIALVQPLMLVGVVMAVPIRAALDLTVPTWRELRAVLITVAGLATFMWGVNPVPATAEPSLVPAALMVLAGVAMAFVVLLTSRRFAGRPNPQAAILGATSGVMFGLTAGLLKLLGAALSSGRTEAAAVPVAALIGVGVLGTAMNQRAYQIAPLSTSMPLLNVIGVLVAVTFGVLVFHEAPGHGPTVLALQCVSLGCLAVGLRQVARLSSRSAPSEPVTLPERCAS